MIDLERATPKERLEYAVQRFGAGLLFTSSFGAGSGVLLHLWSLVAPSAPVVFLDTGFLFEETLAYKDQLARLLGLNVVTVRPALDAAAFMAAHGPRDPDFCCKTNKVDPLAPFEAVANAWVSGLRRDQGKTRSDLPVLAPQPTGPIKVHPLVDMTRDRVRAYMHEHRVPEHPLVSRRYLSIGCAPCTRALVEGEDERAGRWAESGKTECGLHGRFA